MWVKEGTRVVQHLATFPTNVVRLSKTSTQEHETIVRGKCRSDGVLME
jgi:hypothetical protein